MNMSYCRFENTLSDLRDCNCALADMANGVEDSELSRYERAAAKALILLCEQIITDVHESVGPGDGEPVEEEDVERYIAMLEAAAKTPDYDENGARV